VKKYLFIVPHADDEVLGFGGTIAKLVDSGVDVSVTFLQSPNNARAEQQLKDSNKAKEILGYNNLYNLYLPSYTISNDLHTVIHTVQEHLRSISPDVVYTTHCSDNHQDHKALFRAISVVCRPVGPCTSITEVYTGETISSNDQSFSVERAAFTPNIYETLSIEQLNRKILALKAYTTECRQSPHPRCEDIIKARALCRGSEVLSCYAEAFMLLRAKR
jgi:LmbE family N-acetylglucosaminyl deacetylase